MFESLKGKDYYKGAFAISLTGIGIEAFWEDDVALSSQYYMHYLCYMNRSSPKLFKGQLCSGLFNVGEVFYEFSGIRNRCFAFIDFDYEEISSKNLGKKDDFRKKLERVLKRYNYFNNSIDLFNWPEDLFVPPFTFVGYYMESYDRFVDLLIEENKNK